MVKKKKRVARKIWIGMVVVLVFCFIFIAGLVFIFGDDALDVVGVSDLLKDNYVDDNGDGGVFDEGDGDAAFVEDGSGGSSGGGSGVGGGEDRTCVYFEPVQYSIGNFKENIECLVYGVDGCEKVKMNCGSEIFNLDYEIGGDFGIRYSLFFGREELGFEIIEENIAPRGKVVLNSEVIVEGVFDIASLECVVDTDNIPMRCVEWA